MQTVIYRLGLTGVGLLLAVAPVRVLGGEALQAEIQHMLLFIRSSQCQFIRNGQVYDGRQAESHIRRKYGHLEGRIRSAEDFIKYAATQSSVSGRLYLVRCQGREMPTHEWLRAELAAHRRNSSGKGAGPVE